MGFGYKPNLIIHQTFPKPIQWIPKTPLLMIYPDKAKIAAAVEARKEQQKLEEQQKQAALNPSGIKKYIPYAAAAIGVVLLIGFLK